MGNSKQNKVIQKKPQNSAHHISQCYFMLKYSWSIQIIFDGYISIVWLSLQTTEMWIFFNQIKVQSTRCSSQLGLL